MVNEALGVREFLDHVKESGLLPAEEIDRVAHAAGHAADGPSLARAFVSAGLLTEYQTEALRLRRFAELRIGNYEVLARLGAGGMGTVFKARHRRMKRIVALKVLARDLARDDTFVRRFQREVEAIARLSHPNIVMAYDADEDEAGPFLVMEYVNGRDLSTLVETQGPLGVATAVSCIRQAARGMEYAHGQGVIHRDLKPANLLRDDAGTVKVTDLGLARFHDLGGVGGTAASGITQAGSIMGTVDYMPPEQAFDPASIDHRADIYSLGATLHFLLLGRPPYQGPSMMAALLQHRDAPIPLLVAARQDVPAALDAIHGRMLAKAAGDRYQTMAEVARDLEGLAAGLGDAHPGHRIGSSGILPVPASAAGTTGEWRPEDTSVAAAPTPPAATTHLPPPAGPKRTPARVVLVETSRTQSSIISRYLQGQGVAHVVAVASGQDALDAVRRERPDAVVSAFHLPDMTGVQLAQRVRAELPAPTPGFVLISSEIDSVAAGTLSQCGQAVLLHKPFTPAQLVEALRVVAGVPTPPAAADRGRVRVLIVDDSAAARKHIQNVLTGLGFVQFVEATDGARAVAAVAGQAFGLIVTDYNMPYLDGHGLISYLKQNPATASIPVILVTTEQDPGKLEAVRRLDVAAICAKNFPSDEVRRILDRLERMS